MPGSFDLLSQPWLPCLPLDSEAPVSLSLLEILAEAHNYRELVADSPLVAVALHRLLLAIVHRAYLGPRSVEEWRALREAERFDVERVHTYLMDPRWRPHFDLFDSRRPFFQVPEMQDVKPVSVAKLSIERASGNNITLFDHTTGATAAFAPAEAARYLVAFQEYAVGGGVSSPFNLSDGPLARDYTVLVRGRTVFETLMLNLVRYDDGTYMGKPLAEDGPWWERQHDPEPDRSGTTPRGYCDYLTWQSRRVHLMYDEAGHGIRLCQVRQNLKLSQLATTHDPFKPYRVDSKGARVSLRLSEAKAAWRDSHSLLEEAGTSGSRPEVFQWLAETFQNRRGPSPRFRFEVIGYLTDGPQATVMLWRHERLPLPLRYLTTTAEGKALRDELRGGLQVAEGVSRLFGTGSVPVKSGRSKQQRSPVWLLAKELLTRSPERTPDGKDIARLADHFSAERTYWSALEPPFREFMRDLAGEPTHGQVLEDHYEEVLTAWREEVRRIAIRTFDGLLAALESEPEALRAAALARRQFNWLLKKLLPAAEREPALVGSVQGKEERE